MCVCVGVGVREGVIYDGKAWWWQEFQAGKGKIGKGPWEM